MAEVIIENANSCAGPKDKLILAGDMGWKHKTLLEALPRLTAGSIVLVAGNHDAYHPINKKKYEKVMEDLFKVEPRIEFIGTEYMIRIGIYDVLVSHFPYATANSDYLKYRPNKKGNHHFLLHGHSHSSPEKRLDKMNDSLDIGWDAWGHVVPLETIEEIINECYNEEEDWP